MIMRGTTPHTLGWRGFAAVVGLGALLLPMLPAWVQAQAPVKVEAKEVQLKGDVKAVPPEVLPDEAAELTKLRTELAQKQAETAAIAARIEVITANAKKRQADVADRIQAGGGVMTSHNPPVIFKIPVARDVKATDFIEMVKRTEADMHVPSGASVIFVDKDSGKILWTAVASAPEAPAPVDIDKRIIDLEMKLKSILNEVVQLRRERTPDLHSYGPTPLEKIPYIDQLFKQVGPMKAWGEGAAMQERLRAEAEMQKAQSAALAAERDATQAKLKMLEEEIARLKSAQGRKEPAKP